MSQPNYRHLYYFWVVAREGSVTAACSVLHLTQPAISAQLGKLEREMGEKLFARSGRKLVLTEAGRVAFRYAEEIFRTGQELVEALQGGSGARPLRLKAGVAPSLPKRVGYRLLRPALTMEDPVELVVVEDHPERLLADLSVQRLDLVILDSPLPPASNVRAYNHFLGESGVSLFAAPDLAERIAPGFPESLDGAPFILPIEHTTLRRSLDQWLEARQVRPRVAAQVADSAMMNAFGEGGVGVFAAPTVVEEDVVRLHGVRLVGRIDAIRERFYAISAERRLKHPAVVAISEAARENFLRTGRE